MASRLSRRKLAQHIAERILASDESIIDEVAALLVSERRERELDLLVRDVEDWMSKYGELVLTVETARELDAQSSQHIKQMFPDKTVHIRQIINPSLLGGCKITTPSQMLDASLSKKLTTLRSMKV